MSSDKTELFDHYPVNIREKLLYLRQLIFDVAKNTKGVGTLEETIRWGQPTYITSNPKSGSLIRIDYIKKSTKYGIYFHCQTTLVETFRSLYPNIFWLSCDFRGKLTISF